ncbi:MAG: hypothetical protein KF857_04320 [Fimbriimonadaceae bacterium]|nr:hypothetical protein [Fimbriimonadaceae bacterium]
MKRQDIALFLLSFVLTILMWLAVGEPTRNKVFNVPLTIETRDGIAAVYPPAVVSVDVTGSQASMDRLREQDLRAFANVTGYGEGNVNARIMVQGPKDLDLTYTPRDAIKRISLEKEVRATFAVEFRQPGPEGLTAGTVPPKVLVRGPESVVAQVARAVVGYDLNKEAEGQETRWKVELLDRESKPVTALVVEPDTVEIDANLLSLGPRSLVVAPSLFGQPAKGFKYAGTTIKPPVLKAQVPPELASTLASLSTESVHIENASADVTVKVKVILPEGVRLFSPNEVEVTVKVVPDPAAPPPTPPAAKPQGKRG